MPTKPRNAYYTNDSFEIDDPHMGRAFVMAMVTENEPGYYVAGTFSTLERAQSVADTRNRLNGVSADDVLSIVASSMSAGPVR